MKIKNVILLSFILFLMSCYDDKGNYDYSEMAEIKIENLPETLENSWRYRAYCCPTEGDFFIGRRD